MYILDYEMQLEDLTARIDYLKRNNRLDEVVEIEKRVKELLALKGGD
jgi:hypothetical protein